MGQPITWQNVNAPSVGEASRALYLAGNSLNQGFDKLGEVLKQREAVDQSNWNTQRANNTEEIYRQMAQYDTPEAYQAALKSGAIQNIMSGMGAQYDQSAVRGAMDSRMGILQDRTMKANQFLDTTQARDQKPIVEQAMGMAASGDPGLKPFLAANPQITNTAPIIQAGITGEEALRARTRSALVRPEEERLADLNRGNQLNTATNQAEDTTLLRKTAEFGQQHRSDMLDVGKKLGAIASRWQLPVNTDGTARMESYTPEQKAGIYGVAKGKEWGIPNPESYERGDTVAADNFVKSAREAVDSNGKRLHSDAAIARNMNTMREAANSNAGTASVGNAAASSAAARAQTQASMEELPQDSWNPIKSNEAKQGHKEITALIESRIPEAERKAVHKVVSDLYMSGIEAGVDSTGKKRMVAPSTAYVESIINSTSDDWKDFVRPGDSKNGPSVPWYQFGNASLAQKIQHNLTNGVHKNVVIEAAANTEQFKQWARKQRANEIAAPIQK